MNNDFNNSMQITQLLNRYFDSVYNADITALKKIFHNSASMYGYLGDTVVIGTPEIFFADLSSKNSMSKDNIDCKFIIENISITKNVASACVFADGFFGTLAVRDLFHLIKENDKWYIVCKTFTTV